MANAPSTSSDAATALKWLMKLQRELEARNVELARYDKYYRGDHPLLFATSKFREAFGALFRAFADNWTELVVDAVEERLNVEGFRLEGDQFGEKKAWKYWQGNDLDADSQLAHTEALINGMSYVLVWPSDNGVPTITVEDPTEVIVAHPPGARCERAAALKLWQDFDEGRYYATVYLPDAVWKFQSAQSVSFDPKELWGMGSTPAQGAATAVDALVPNWNPSPSTLFDLQKRSWEPREVVGEPWPLPNKQGEVPIVPLYNKPRMRTRGVSEIKNVIPMQDAANKLLADMMVASEFAAFRQRWATGLEIPNDPETNRPLLADGKPATTEQAAFEHAINRLWTSPSKETTFGEFSASDLTNYTKAIELVVQHIASQTRTPPHYFYLSGQFPSGESIKSAETGLVAKARRRMRHFGEGWEEVIRLAFAADGDAKRAGLDATETIWGDPESRSESEHVDATVKLRAIGIPLQSLWERAGFTPTQIERFKEQRAEEIKQGIADVPPVVDVKPPTVKL